MTKSLSDLLNLKCGTKDVDHSENELYAQTTNKGKIRIELVGENKIISQQQVRKLRTASITHESIVSVGDLSNCCPCLQILVLDRCSFDSWNVLNKIVDDLPKLVEIHITNTLLPKPISGSFCKNDHVSCLNLSSTGLRWVDFEIPSNLRNLKELSLLKDNICKLSPFKNNFSTFLFCDGFVSLDTLHLEDNQISTWNDIVFLGMLPHLRRLYLSNNKLSTISWDDYLAFSTSSSSLYSFPHFASLVFPLNFRLPIFSNLAELWLNGNLLNSWQSIVSLSFFPGLQKLHIHENPLFRRYPPDCYRGMYYDNSYDPNIHPSPSEQLQVFDTLSHTSTTTTTPTPSTTLTLPAVSLDSCDFGFSRDKQELCRKLVEKLEQTGLRGGGVCLRT
jgi:hypothetical protein